MRYGDMSESVQSIHLLEVQMTLSFNQVLHRFQVRLLICVEEERRYQETRLEISVIF